MLEIEIDNITTQDWFNLLTEFRDASLYQTWSYGTVRWGEQSLSHLVLKNDGIVVAIAQIVIIKKSFLGGIAYVRWGGLWRRKDQPDNLEIFKAMLIALREEYARKRGLYLRILPNIRTYEGEKPLVILQEEGFKFKPSLEGGRTLYIDLSLSLADLRMALQARWRNYLKRSENNGLIMIEKSQDELYTIFSEMYKKMHARKGFVIYVDINEYKKIQAALPEQFKMKIMACELMGVPHAAIVCAAFGDTGIYVLGATSDEGLKHYGSYLLHWKMLEWLKSEGYRWYDLGGIDPEKEHGTAQFKYGLAGKNGIDSGTIGQFDICFSPITQLVIQKLDSFRLKYRQLKAKFK